MKTRAAESVKNILFTSDNFSSYTTKKNEEIKRFDDEQNIQEIEIRKKLSKCNIQSERSQNSNIFYVIIIVMLSQITLTQSTP